MAIDIMATALEFLAEYGLWAIFVLLVLDGAMLMPVFPGELVMIIAVAEYAHDLGDLVMLVALATGAAVLGSLLLYGICRGGGRRLIENHPRLFMMSPRRRKKLEKTFAHPVGQSLVFFLRLIPFTRVLVNIPAGLARMKLGRFLVLTTIGMVIFHAGFMYFAFLHGEPGAGVGVQAASLQEAYASPAWDYMQANEVITGVALVVLGAVLSLRASRNIMKEPDWATRSLIGWLAERILLFGGISILVVLWVDPGILFQLAETGGLDIEKLATDLNWEPVSFLALIGAGASLLGLLLMGIARVAKRRRQTFQREQEYAELRAEEERRRMPAFESVEDDQRDDAPSGGPDEELRCDPEDDA